jgi:peptide/nickel transport system ATP-binding protein
MAGSGTAHMRRSGDALLRVENLRVEFRSRPGGVVQAVSDVSLDVVPGETLALVGESGCGKSTTGRAIVQLQRVTSGRVIFEGRDLTRLRTSQLRPLRRKFQMIFQDPISSLNPRRTIRQIIEEPLRVWRHENRRRGQAVDTILEAVGLDPNVVGARHPHELSGGQCQRISIARSLILDPKLLVCDEPVSALDVSIQAQILNLLEETKSKYGLTLVFISHDLTVVKNVSDRVVVMYLGKLCEVGPPEVLFESPAHPYTAALLSSIPLPDPEAHRRAVGLLEGDLPSPVDPPSGCRFRTRCPYAREQCTEKEPEMRSIDGRRDHAVACHFPLA